MCGVFCLVCRGEDTIKNEPSFALVREAILNRGPDYFGSKIVHLVGDWYGFFAGSVLWTQGSKGPTCQPLSDDNGNVFLWNGDIYSGLEKDETLGLSDTELMFSALKEYKCTDILSKVCGPYAFVFWDASRGRLWWGRDPIGRHSLICDISLTRLLLSSVDHRQLCRGDGREVPTSGVFSASLVETEIGLEIHPWAHLENSSSSESVMKLSAEIKETVFHTNFTRFGNLQPYSTESLQESQFDFLKDFKPGQPLDILDSLLLKPMISQRVEFLEHLLIDSVCKRAGTLPPVCRNCCSVQHCQHTRLGVLFSGGLDSTLLAFLAHRFVSEGEPIDLYNVAFESPRKCGSNDFTVPDRVTAKCSILELTSLIPNRQWNLVEINITQEELCRLRDKRICHLILPLDSILDDSLGCALWFAARGEGVLNGQYYRSSARVVILGMGADELFGGYSRHRRTLKAVGWKKLGQELEAELWAIGRRNLGRDNRIVTDHGRQPRAPFLDEEIVRFALSLAPWEKCCLTPEMGSGLGDKLLLRLVARRLGLTKVATFPKRALQFGSRIANPKEKGHLKCKRLEDTFLNK